VFYSINVWDPRWRRSRQCFSAPLPDDKVSLVLKTSTAIDASSLERRTAGGIPERIRALQDGIAAETGRPCAHVAVIAAEDVSGRVIDAVHATGDCYVSLSHGEGWGMGAFDAATLGKPVLIAPYGGPADYLRCPGMDFF
jgi:hypothetical protein